MCLNISQIVTKRMSWEDKKSKKIEQNECEE